MSGDQTKPCVECNAPFPPRNKASRFCSKPCRVRWLARDWRQKNPERAKELDRKSHAPKREQRNAKVREWHAAHKDEENAKRRQHHDEHKDHANAKRRAWYQAHREHSAEKSHAWYVTNCEYAKGIEKVRFEKKRVAAPQILLLFSSRYRAKQRKLTFTLTEEWANRTWTGRCAVTGIPFELGTGRVMRSPSLDRIKPELGYVPENCRFVLWAVNMFKGTGTDTSMLEIAKAMLESFVPVG